MADCPSWWPATSTPNMWIGTRGRARDGEIPTSLCRRKLLSDLWTGHPNHKPIQYLRTLDDLDIVVTKNLSHSVYLTSCSALCSDHLPVRIDTACRSSFDTHRIALISGTLTGPTSRLTWKIKLRSTRNWKTRWQSIVRWELLRRRSEDSGNIYSQVSRAGRPMASDSGWHWGWCTPEEQAAEVVAGNHGPRVSEPRPTACRGRWPAGSKSGGTTSGVRRYNPSIPNTNHCGGWPNVWWEFLLRLPLVTP
jgi:hypothetical protein